ncbi:MAG TPA: hypothetical protein VK435_00965, partial [Thermodesulfovibrionales bacterium]|nr:hypothetical protein [Thermodesulfovibrionales bacterium]
MLKTVSRLFSVSILIVLFACAPKHVAMPSFEGMDLNDALAARKNIAGIDTVFSLVYEKEDSEIKGDGAVYVSRSGYVNMRIYSFGFLAFELSSSNGVVKSSPSIDKNKALILTDGLRDCLFWWDIKDFEVQEKEGKFILTNSRRQIWIDEKTMLPVRQIISVEDGRELDIYYENPEKSGDLWYPSKIRIELSKNALT